MPRSKTPQSPTEGEIQWSATDAELAELATCVKAWLDARNEWQVTKARAKVLKDEAEEKQEALNRLCCRLTAEAPLFEQNGEAGK